MRGVNADAQQNDVLFGTVERRGRGRAGSSLHGAASTERDSIPARVTEQAGNKRDSVKLMFGRAALDRGVLPETGGTHELYGLITGLDDSRPGAADNKIRSFLPRPVPPPHGEATAQVAIGRDWKLSAPPRSTLAMHVRELRTLVKDDSSVAGQPYTPLNVRCLVVPAHD